MEEGAVRVEVVRDERYWYPDEGGEVWLAGYQLVEPGSGRYLGRDAPELAARGLRVAGVAGAGRHHAAALQSPALAPGRPLALRRDPGNPHDPNAIAVHAAADHPSSGEGGPHAAGDHPSSGEGGPHAAGDHPAPGEGGPHAAADHPSPGEGGAHGAGEGAQVGWVPRELAAELAPQLDAGRAWTAVVLREQRPSPRAPRTGLTMLLAPTPTLALRVIGPGQGGPGA
jgi:hypothetical protein